MHRGEIWWANVPGDKRRPVLILTRERFIDRLNSVLVAPVSTNDRGIPTEVGLDEADGMPRPCAANFDNTFALRRTYFDEPITALSGERLEHVCADYRFAANC